MEKLFYGEYLKLGILGGGQLGRMFIQNALNYDVRVDILEKGDDAPSKTISNNYVQGDIQCFDDVYNFGKNKNILTVEIENVNIEALERLEKENVKVFPQPRVLKIIKDKGLQKQFYKAKNIPTADFRIIKNKKELTQNDDFLPCFQKLRTGGYDGKGVMKLDSRNALNQAFDEPSVLEKYIDFEKELSVIVARNEKGEIKSFPVVECEFNPELNLVEFLFTPAEISPEVELRAQNLAKDVIEKLDMVGILAVELFLTKDSGLLVNEVAPRPHNSGHHTIECNYTSQFDQHLRSICNLPLGDTSLRSPGVMVNLIGSKEANGKAVYHGMEEFLEKKGVFFHLYGKSQTKPGRKMGHVTVINSSINDCKFLAREILSRIRVLSM